MNRRNIIKNSSYCLAGMAAANMFGCKKPAKQTNMTSDSNHPLFFKISLAQWSLHRSIEQNEINVLDFAAIAKNDFGIEAVEYVNGFYKDKVNDTSFWKEVNLRSDDNGVSNLLIMVDDEGDLGSTVDQERSTAVENHFKWVDAAQQIGCHSVRINAFGDGTKQDVGIAMVDALGRLCEHAKQADINILIENHGLYSSDAEWVNHVINQVNMPNCGTLPDFGNFCLSKKWGSTQDGTCEDIYDRYKGVKEMMPHAFGVSAKSYAFGKNGDETTIDYQKMLQIVKGFSFSGHIGIEYEGDELSEMEGIRATKKLLERLGGMKG